MVEGRWIPWEDEEGAARPLLVLTARVAVQVGSMQSDRAIHT